MLNEIAIIGAAGKMGYWFSKYFSTIENIRLTLYDEDLRSLRLYTTATIAESIDECVKTADMVLVCVPIKNTPLTIKECAKKMKSGSILAEISSVKHNIIKTLKEISKNVNPLCIHPMFGPGAKTINQMRIILIPVRCKERELRILEDLFHGAIISVIPNAEIHDKSIAIILGLTHYINLVFASILSEEDTISLKTMAGTTFGVQSLLSESILTHDPDLIAALLTENPFVTDQIRNYLDQANKLANDVFKSDTIKIKTRFERIRSILQKQQDLDKSYKLIYDITEKINDKYVL